jgi:hypothetical protein
MFKKKQKTIPAVAAATVAVISDDLTAITKQAQKVAKKRKSKKAANDRLAQAVTILACIMAAAYIAIRIFNWIRFI